MFSFLTMAIITVVNICHDIDKGVYYLITCTVHSILILIFVFATRMHLYQYYHKFLKQRHISLKEEVRKEWENNLNIFFRKTEDGGWVVALPTGYINKQYISMPVFHFFTYFHLKCLYKLQNSEVYKIILI